MWRSPNGTPPEASEARAPRHGPPCRGASWFHRAKTNTSCPEALPLPPSRRHRTLHGIGAKPSLRTHYRLSERLPMRTPCPRLTSGSTGFPCPLGGVGRIHFRPMEPNRTLSCSPLVLSRAPLPLINEGREKFACGAFALVPCSVLRA